MDKLIEVHAVDPGEPMQPGAQRFAVAGRRVKRPPVCHGSSRSNMRRRSVGPTYGATSRLR